MAFLNSFANTSQTLANGCLKCFTRPPAPRSAVPTIKPSLYAPLPLSPPHPAFFAVPEPLLFQMCALALSELPQLMLT